MRGLRTAVAILALATLAVASGDHYAATWWQIGRPAPLAAGHTTLRVGVDASYPPFAAVSPEGDLWGFEVDLARALGNRLDLPLDLRNADAGSGLDALPAGAYDAILAGLPLDPDLTKTVRFSRPYFDAGPVLLARPGAPASLEGTTILVEAGTPWTATVDNLRSRGAGTISTWDIFDGVKRVAAGEADAVLLDRPTALEQQQIAAGADLGLRLLGERDDYGYRVALGRSNRYLALAVDEALRGLSADGTLAGLERRWFGGTDGD